MKKSTAQPRQTGPITSAGKQRSSKNALTHGATSQRFLSPDEQHSYEQHLTGLRQTFPATNYLIDLQIQRLAKLHVQAERIQKIIDAQMVKSQQGGEIEAALRNQLGLDHIQAVKTNEISRLLYESIMGEEVPPSMKDFPLVEWAQYLFKNPDITSEDLLMIAPGFALFLYHEARNHHENINQYLSRLIHNRPKDETVFHEQVKLFLAKILVKQENEISEDVKEAVAAIDDGLLKRFTFWYIDSCGYQQSSKIKIKLFEKHLPIHRQAAMPNGADLDRLVRYQTSCERQISTVTGELLHMYERFKNKVAA